MLGSGSRDIFATFAVLRKKCVKLAIEELLSAAYLLNWFDRYITLKQLTFTHMVQNGTTDEY